jgi:hypothetical protein
MVAWAKWWTSIATPDGTITIGYDTVGNRTQLWEDDQIPYTYDNNGNLETKTSKANPIEVTTCHWDAQVQLIQIDRPVCAVKPYMAKFGKYRYD